MWFLDLYVLFKVAKIHELFFTLCKHHSWSCFHGIYFICNVSSLIWSEHFSHSDLPRLLGSIANESVNNENDCKFLVIILRLLLLSTKFPLFFFKKTPLCSKSENLTVRSRSTTGWILYPVSTKKRGDQNANQVGEINHWQHLHYFYIEIQAAFQYKIWGVHVILTSMNFLHC